MTPPVAPDRPLFIAQDKLTQWESEGKVTVAGNVLTLVAEKRGYQLAEAVRFLKVAGAEADPHGLVGRVRTREQLKQLKAEHYMGSAIIGETAYEVQEGFVGTVINAAPRPSAAVVSAPPTPRAAPSAPPVAPELETPQTDAQLLADFLLSHHSG